MSREAGADHGSLEVGDHGPPARGVESRGIGGDIAQVGGHQTAEAGHGREVVHVSESMAGARSPPWPSEQRSTLHKRVFVLAPESARVQHVAGTRKRPGGHVAPGRSLGETSADVAQLVEHHLAKVDVASSSLVVRSMWGIFPNPLTPGGVAERRGNGLQSRLHGFKSRLHLQGRLAQRESASLTRKRSLVQSQYRPLDPRRRTGCPSRAISSAGERFPDTEEVTGSIPVSRTQQPELRRSVVPRTISSAGERFPDTEEVTGSIPVSSTPSPRAGAFRSGPRSLCGGRQEEKSIWPKLR